MWDNPQDDQPALPWPAWLFAGLFLLALIIMARAEGRAHSADFEELRQSAAGWAYRVAGDWRFHPSEPPLGKTLLGMAVRSEAASAPESLAGWLDGNALSVGRELFSGEAGARRLNSARRVSLLFALILAIGVFRWSAELWGAAGGFLSLALCVFSPAIPGFAALASVDMIATTFLFYAVYGFWRMCDQPGIGRVFFTALATGCAIAAQYANLQVVAILAGLSLLGVFFGGEFFPLIEPGRRPDPRALWLRMVWNYTVVLALCFAGSWIALWASRGFEFWPGWYFVGLQGNGIEESGSLLAPGWTLLCRTHPAILLLAAAGALSVRQGRFYDGAFLTIAGALSLIAVSSFRGAGRLSEVLLIQILMAVTAGAFLRNPFSMRIPQAILATAGIVWLAVGTWNRAPDNLAYVNLLAGNTQESLREIETFPKLGPSDRSADEWERWPAAREADTQGEEPAK